MVYEITEIKTTRLKGCICEPLIYKSHFSLVNIVGGEETTMHALMVRKVALN